MKKKLVISGIAAFLVLGLLAVGFNMNKTAAVASGESDVYKYIKVDADFAKAYDSYDELMSDSEVVAFGTVKKVHSYIDDSRIVSKFDFDVSSVEKGSINKNDTISVETIGGKVTYSDYLTANKGYLEAKTSPEYVANEIKSYGSKYIESIFEGVPNIKEGDQLLLFLSMQDDNVSYYILGSSYYGQFYYDSEKEEIYKIKEDDPAKREMTISRDQFKEKLDVSIDNSSALKQEKENKQINKENIEVEKDSAYDKYKKWSAPTNKVALILMRH